MTTMHRCLIGMAVAVVLTQDASAYTKYVSVTVDATSGGVGFVNADLIVGSGHVQATQATCRLETGQIRYTYDGTAPTASVGLLWEVGEEKTITGNAVLQAFRGFRTSGTSGDLKCHLIG